MRIKRIISAAVLAGTLVVPTAACVPADSGSTGSGQAVEDQGAVDDDGGDDADACELDDQHEGDRDCGHYSSPGVWAWYYWVVLGKVTYPPAGWKRPYSYPKSAGAAPVRTAGSSTTQRPTTATTRSNMTGTQKSTTGGGTRTSTGGSSSGGGGRR